MEKTSTPMRGIPTMAHATLTPELDVELEYRLLQERLDRNVTGAPDSPAMRRILRMLFTPEDAHVARRLPQFISIPLLAKKLEVDVDDLNEHITSMARRGLVLDIERKGTRFVMAAPVVIGFFEFVFMRERPDAPMEDYAAAFEDVFDDEAFVRSVFTGKTQLGRSFVREEALPAEVEILDWERATEAVRTADAVTVSLCPCRADARLREDGCDAPLRACLSFGGAAEMLARSGIGEAITNDEAMDILEEAKAAGLAQTGDNVREGITYMCNCCGCCCGMMRSIKKYSIYDGIVPSNWMATVDHSMCRGCATCAKACPADAIEIEPTNGKGLRKNWAVIDSDRCLGCGVCGDVCRWDAHGMEPRAEQPYIPADTMERVALMAIERGKLGDLLYDNVGSRLGQIAARSLSVIERMPPWKAAMAATRLRSVFLTTLTDQLRARSGPAV
ncbi:MAG: 4Fe-4S dicluster domain-containing protein [Acidimicrobiia bacterium]